MKEKEFTLFYHDREIGVSHYPMPCSSAKEYAGGNISFLPEKKKRENREMLLYIHIPFCEQICSFCPYNKVLFSEGIADRYLKCLYKEITWYAEHSYLKYVRIRAVYFGGGTPSILTEKQMTDLIKIIKEKFNLAQNAEITVEGNPHSFNPNKIEILKQNGVNRISLGIQTFQDEIGKTLHLPHTSKEALKIIQHIKRSGIKKLSIDLMYNLPKQTLSLWMDDVKKAVKLKIGHITLFHLKVVPGTGLFQECNSGSLQIGDLNRELQMYESAMRYLLKKGYHQESTYDFVLEGNESLYGKKHYVEHSELLGLGVSAFGEIGGYTYINNGKVNEYIDNVEKGMLPILLQDSVPEEEKIYGIMSMGLRMLEVDLNTLGDDKEKIFKVFSEQLSVLFQNQLLEITDGKIRLTEIGRLWGNNICKEFYSEDYKKSLPAWQRMEELARTKKEAGK